MKNSNDTAFLKLAMPKGLIELPDEVCSNFDHKINEEVVERLKSGRWYAIYPAWGWRGEVWYADGLFHCQVRQHGMVVDTKSASDFSELKDELCNSFGST